LTSIAGALRLLAGGVAGPLSVQGTSLLGIAQKNADRLARLIDDLLEVGRLQSGRARLDLAPVELGELVRQSLAQNRPFADGRGVALRQGEPLPEVRVMGDPDRLLQVMANLLSNAIKLSPRGGTAEVAVERHLATARIAVRDHGPGVPEEFRARIFQRFAQADASDRRRHGGTGLGLSIVREIVAAHGGEVGFEDAPGGGTVFHVDLPLAGTAEA
jgi:signal transduction histidine kinase